MLAIVESIAHFSKLLGIKTIAEYVSSEEIMRVCQSAGLDYLQGFHTGKPQPRLLGLPERNQSAECRIDRVIDEEVVSG